MATPVGRSISTRTGNANCTFTAPKNSGEGRDALSAALRGAAFGGSTNLAGCVDFARSSSSGAPTTSLPGGLTYVPMAIDSVTFATLNISNVPHSLTKAQLVSIYSANTGSCVGTFTPLLPPLGSGTRTFFVQSLGLTDVAIGATGGPGTCVKDVDSAGTPIQEHDGRFLTNANQLEPFSTAQYIAQQAGYISNQLGRAALGAVDVGAGAGSVSPLQLKTTFGLTREVYNVVGTNALGSSTALSSTFATSSSKVCQATTTIEHYGFAADSNCGNTTLVKGNSTP
jgi:hypothetical protein